MKKTNPKKQSKTAVLYPPPFHFAEKDEEAIHIACVTKYKRAAIAIADSLEQLAQQAAADADILEGKAQLPEADEEKRTLGFMARLELYDIVYSAVARLNQLAIVHPEKWDIIAMSHEAWPVHYNTTSMAKRLANELVEKLHVGKSVFPRVHPKSKFDPGVWPTQGFANQLLNQIRTAHDRADIYSKIERQPAPGWRRDALKLKWPPTTKIERDQWRAVAEKVLIEAGIDAAQYGQEQPTAGAKKHKRGDSFRKTNFWQSFDSLLKDAIRHDLTFAVQ